MRLQKQTLRERLRFIQFRWLAVIIAAAAALVLFVVIIANQNRARERQEMAFNRSQKELEEASKRQEEKINRNSNVGNMQAIEIEARTQGMVKEGEICFEITNPEKLDAYSEDEMAILMQEHTWRQ